MRRYEVTCEVQVDEDDVWDYLDSEGKDSDELRESGYELTNDDWRSAAEAKFLDDDYTYYDFRRHC
jgi:hypothetical protein